MNCYNTSRLFSVLTTQSRHIRTKAMHLEQAIGSITAAEKHKEQELAKQECSKIIEEHGKFPNPITKLVPLEGIYKGLGPYHQRLQDALYDSKKDKINANIHEYKVARITISLLKLVFNHRIRHVCKVGLPKKYVITILQILRHYRKMHLTCIYDALVQMISRKSHKYRKWFITTVLLSKRLELAPQLSNKSANNLLKEYVRDFKAITNKSMSKSRKNAAKNLLLDTLQLLHLYCDYQIELSPRSLIYIKRLTHMLYQHKDPLIQEILHDISSIHK